MKKTFVTIFCFLITFHCIGQLRTEQAKGTQCIKTGIIIKSEFKKRPRSWFFGRKYSFRTKNVDRAVDVDGNVVLKGVTRSIEHGDVFKIKTYSRLLIEGSEIVNFLFEKNESEGKAIYYNFCGEKLREENVTFKNVYMKF